MKTDVYKFLCSIRLSVISPKPHINSQEVNDLNDLKKIFKATDYKDDNIVKTINAYLKKPVFDGNKLKNK